MDLTVTLALLAFVVAFGALCAWQGARPPDPVRGPRMVPWRFLMVLCVALALLLVVHVVNLLGYETGEGTRFGP